VKDLLRGSTPLDMAYRIHTDIGDHCAGARIITNTDDSGHLVTRLVPLDYELKGGEIVEIIVNRTVHPTRDWLSFARTAAARNKIRRYLKAYEREINLHLGHERLELALKAAGFKGINERVEELLTGFCHGEPSASMAFKKYSTLDDVYIALGREDLLVEQVVALLVERLPQSELPGNAEGGEKKGLYPSKESENTHFLQLASCCCPIPGDAIVGQFIPCQGVLVHRSACDTLKRSREANSNLVEVSWQQVHPESYLVPITLIAHDRSGLLRDVAAVVADASINMVSVTSSTSPSLQKAVITATLEISDDGSVLEQVERLLRRLRQVKTVVSVERAVGK
jgi:guanosine-3',5'-bis(diphosphate) 3'-pyrophosphohydrolase